jgi:CheY-like chemotaxis protein
MPSTSAARRPLVLVADLEPTARAAACAALEHAGFETAVAEDGKALAALAKQRRPRAIVLDIMTAALHLRADPATRDIPAIVLTGEATPLFRTLSAAIGATAYVLKPIAPEQLVEVVRRVIADRARGVPR